MQKDAVGKAYDMLEVFQLRDRKYFQKMKQKCQKYIIKNELFDGLYQQIGYKEKLSELEGISIEITQNETKKLERKNKIQQPKVTRQYQIVKHTLNWNCRRRENDRRNV